MSAWRAPPPPPGFARSPSPASRGRIGAHPPPWSAAQWGRGTTRSVVEGEGLRRRICGRLGRDAVKDYTEEKTLRVRTTQA
jgi:hypothetical protein